MGRCAMARIGRLILLALITLLVTGRAAVGQWTGPTTGAAGGGAANGDAPR